MNNPTQQQIDKYIEKRLVSMMKKNSPKLLSYFLILTAKIMTEANAVVLDLSQDCSMDGNKTRICISAKFRIKKVKPAK